MLSGPILTYVGVAAGVVVLLASGVLAVRQLAKRRADLGRSYRVVNVGAPWPGWVTGLLEGAAAGAGSQGRALLVDLSSPAGVELRGELELAAGSGRVVVQVSAPPAQPVGYPARVVVREVPGPSARTYWWPLTGVGARTRRWIYRELRVLEPPPAAGERRSRRPLLAALAAATVAIVAVALQAHRGAGGDAAGSPPAPATSPPVATTAAETTKAPAPSRPARVSYGRQPAGSQRCDVQYDLSEGPTRSAVDPATTTCPFAENVRKGYVIAQSRGAGVAGDTVKVMAWSPKREINFRMTCVGQSPVTCTGGTNALVYLYR